ncbi:excinuclease ABC subunit C [Candidatus Micrarchaeota archaeon CG1_02_55_22]|nr:MAG: excinuclease ABC subunit C [Candidatus Micrarchaeota archaeon CG1_02_55_22]
MIALEAPHQPGVYLFKDAASRTIYIGKAKDLYARLQSYRNPPAGKTAEMVRNAHGLDWITCRNEAEALVLENTLIKQHRPKYNVDLKDGVHYAYLKVTNEKYPRILVSRTRKAGKNEKVLGPYLSAQGRTVALHAATRTFGLRICNKLPKQACLQYHLGYCSAPCINNTTEEEYSQNVSRAEKVLAGKTGEIAQAMESEMRAASAKQEFERAMQLRDRLSALHRIEQKQLMESRREGNDDYFGFVRDGEKLRCCVLKSRDGLILDRDVFALDVIGDSPQAEVILRYYETHAIPNRTYTRLGSLEEEAALAEIIFKMNGKIITPKKGDALELVRLAEKNAALQTGVSGSSTEAVALQKALGLYKPPATIDCFDASNLAGKQVVGSCVRFDDGKPVKNHYRRFKIRSFAGQDDFAAMHEIVYRRYRSMLEKGEAPPDLILIDGGPGQLNAALSALSELSIDIPTAALAKKDEEIYLPELMEPRRLPKSHAGLKLLMRCRDEAHRFALKYNRLRRKIEQEY